MSEHTWLAQWNNRRRARKRKKVFHTRRRRHSLLERLEPRMLLAGLRETTVSFAAVADLSVRESGDPEVGNFYVGSQPREEAYIRFDIGAWRGDVSQAVVRLVPADDQQPLGRHAAFAVSNDSWTEQTVRWDRRPQADATALARWEPTAEDFTIWEVSRRPTPP